jgi:hypothetical protein
VRPSASAKEVLRLSPVLELGLK